MHHFQRRFPLAKIHTCNNGVDALDLMKKQEFEVVIMDVCLPGKLDGLQATRAYRKYQDEKEDMSRPRKKNRILGISASNDFIMRNAAEKAGNVINLSAAFTIP